MKKMLITVALALSCFLGVKNVSALEVIDYHPLSLDTISSGGFLYAGCTENYGFSQVKYVRLSFDNPNNANLRVYLLYNTAANSAGSSTYSSSTITISGSDKHVIYFIPQDMSCPSDATTCVKVSPNHTIGTANETRVSDTLNYTGIKIENKSLLKTLKITNGQVRFYYGA